MKEGLPTHDSKIVCINSYYISHPWPQSKCTHQFRSHDHLGILKNLDVEESSKFSISVI